ncbi:MAG: Crp/Fnr family transcriptional regulator [Bacteroidia bacterium]
MPFAQIKKYYFEMVPSLTDEIWDEMKSNAIFKKYKKGENYIVPGEQENYVTFINKGGFRFFTIVDERELTCDFIFENDYISEYEGFLKRTPANIYIQALEDSEVIKFHYDNVQECYEKYPQLQKFGRLIAEKFLLDVIERSNSLLFSTPEDRYNKLAINNPQLLQRVPQYMIASFIGVTPEALSRIRKRMVYAMT